MDSERRRIQTSRHWIIVLPLLLLSACDGDKKDVTGDINVTTPPTVTPLQDDRGPLASMKIVWSVQAPCACDKIKVRQEIKGYIERIDQDGKSGKLTARDLVEKATAGLDADKFPEVKAFRASKPVAPAKDNSETEYVPDIGGHGTSTYPPNLIMCTKVDDKKSKIELRDDPGVNSHAGASNPFKKIILHLTFRTTVTCDDKQIGQFIWHANYEIPPPSGTPAPDVGLGENK
jgi:hypothetical protein